MILGLKLLLFILNDRLCRFFENTTKSSLSAKVMGTALLRLSLVLLAKNECPDDWEDDANGVSFDDLNEDLSNDALGKVSSCGLIKF